MYQTILFDLDGTLTNSELGITNSVAYALGKYGIEVPDKKALRVFIGPPLQDSFERFYGKTVYYVFALLYTMLLHCTHWTPALMILFAYSHNF